MLLSRAPSTRGRVGALESDYLERTLQNAVLSMMRPSAGRPRNFDEDDVLDKAVDLFWRQGFRSTTTRDLEVVLGLSQSSLYNAFGSKRELFLAALDRYESASSAVLAEPLECSQDGIEGIRRFFDMLADWVAGAGRRGCLIINLMAEHAEDDDEITRRTAAYRERVRSALGKALERAADSGQIEWRSLDVRTDLLFGIVLSINVSARTTSADPDVTRQTAAVHHLIDSWCVPAAVRH